VVVVLCDSRYSKQRKSVFLDTCLFRETCLCPAGQQGEGCEEGMVVWRK